MIFKKSGFEIVVTRPIVIAAAKSRSRLII
jgi:hypothetical protein